MLIILLPWPNKHEKSKAFKKDISKELMPVSVAFNKMVGLANVRR